MSTKKVTQTTQPGDWVLLIGRDRKSFIIRLKPSQQFHTHHGTIAHDDLIGAPWGGRVSTQLNYPFALLRPSTDELVRDLKRTSQIVYPKDAGYILMKMNITPKSHVVEAGTGSGGLTMVFALAVSPTGHVTTYDNRPQALDLAQENLAQLGLSDVVTFKQRDIAEGFDETEADALFLDLRTPWDYLPHVRAALVNGGFFGAILPTANQVIRLLDALEKFNFGPVEVEELLLRPYKTVPERLRPQDRLTPHTGYLIFARKLIPLEK